MEESRLQASHMLQSSLQSNGDRRYATPPQQIAAYNRNSVPKYKDMSISQLSTPISPPADIVYGEDVSRDFLKGIRNIIFLFFSIIHITWKFRCILFPIYQSI